MRSPVPSSGPLLSVGQVLRPARAGVIALAAAAALAGCGGDGDAKSEATGAGTNPVGGPAIVDNGSPEAEAIQKTNQAAYAAIRDKDGAAFCKLLTEESVKILVGGIPGKGTDEAKCATVATKIAEGMSAGDVTPERLDKIQVTGETAIGQTGDRVTSFEKVDGTWLLGATQAPASTTP